MRLDQAQRIMPRAPVEWLLPLLVEMPRWGIDTTNEQASFLAQIAHESRELTRLEESLSYSATRLMAVWPRRFPDMAAALAYEHAPAALGNKVYADRMGNGGPETGDGYRFRGRTPVMLTGRANYRAAERALGVGLVADPGLALVPAVGCQIACWYWRAHGFDAVDDDADIREETRLLNGGETGLKQRDAYFRKALEVLNG